MKRKMSIAAIALFMAGSSAFACDGCGCSAKKSEKAKSECSKDKTAEKKCGADCKKACSTKKADNAKK